MKFKYSYIVLFLVSLLIFSCDKEPLGGQSEPDTVDKFEPEDGEVILLIGQGDTTEMNDYMSASSTTPAGFMFYINLIDPTDELARIKAYVEKHENIVLQIGIWTGGDYAPGAELVQIDYGNRDDEIIELATWTKEMNIPIYYRFGYEFDGIHNAYPPANYKPAYQRFVDLMNSEGVDNAAYVWHTYMAAPYNNHTIDEWYPGDEYVDWMGVSIFGSGYGNLVNNDEANNVLDYAREKGKPIMIAESASIYTDSIVISHWNGWFYNTLNFCNDNDEVKMFCYINTDWDGSWGDTRIEKNPTVLGHWLTATENYLKSDASLYGKLGFE